MNGIHGFFALVRIALLAVLVTLCGCDALNLGALNAAGPVAEGQRHLFHILAVVLAFVAGPVLLLVPLIAWHYRLSNTHSAFRPRWSLSWVIEGFIWIPPSLIVIGLGILLWDATQRLDPYRPIASTMAPIEIQAVALDWKWLFIYPEQRIAVVNQLSIPAGRSIHLSITSGTVMQSLLIPRLAGQIYAMAGMRTELNLAADHPGTYQGANVQYNGAGFQNQRFEVVALTPSDFGSWLDRVSAGGQALDAVAYGRLAEPSVVARPIFFSHVDDGFFQQVLARATSGPGAGR